MFKKLKAELKAAFKSKKNPKSSTSNSPNSEVLPLQEHQHRVSQTFDGGLGRPRGYSGRKSVDVTRQGSENKDAGDMRPAYSSESGMVQRHVEQADHAAPSPLGHEHNSSPRAQPHHNPHSVEQQQHHSQQQHQQGLLSPLDTPSSPQSPSSPMHQHRQGFEAADAAATLDPGSTAGTPTAEAKTSQSSEALTGTSSKANSKSSSSWKHSSQTAAAGASASRSQGPEPSRTPRDEDLGTCPPYATKAVWGLRYSMEDKWAAVPSLIQVPLLLTAQQKKSGNAGSAKAAGCGCMIKPSKVLAKVSPSLRSEKNLEHVPLVASHHGSDELTSSQELLLQGSGVPPDMDSLHYFGVFDGHGGADAARHCAQRMHQVLVETVRSMLTPDITLIAAPVADSSDPPSNHGESATATQQDAHQQVSEQTSVDPPAAAATSSDPAASAEAASSQPVSAASNSVNAGGSSASASSSSKDWTMATLASSNGSWLSAALSKSFVSLDSEFGVLSEGSYVGSTAVVVLLGSTRLWVAHAGDSRAVLGRRGSAVVLTSDHKASRDDEVARVQAAGGHVWWDRVMGELAVSRAIGDHCLRPYVIPEPEVSMVERTRDDEVLVMASDGLWDVINNQEAAEMALHTLQAAEGAGHVGVAAAKRAATSLTKAALDRGTRDNVTVLVVDLRVKGLAGSQHSSANNSSSANATSPAAAPAAAPSPGQEKCSAGSSSSSSDRSKETHKIKHHAVTTPPAAGAVTPTAAVDAAAAIVAATQSHLPPTSSEQQKAATNGGSSKAGESAGSAVAAAGGPADSHGSPLL